MTNAAQPIDRSIFITSFAAITATSFCFVLRALVIDAWGVEFALTETQKGELLGVGLWPFAISIVLLSLVIDRIGFKRTLWFAVACHSCGLAILLMAGGYWSLYCGTFIMALGNGAVEASVNPLIATVYAHDKPRWLNRLHAAWPGGMVLGGLLAIWLGDGVSWRAKVALMAAPILIYALLLVRRRLPASERAAAGVPYRTMLSEAGYLSALIIVAMMMLEIGRVFSLSGTLTLVLIAALTIVCAYYARSAGRPLYVILLLLMIPLAITELSTDSWISSLMQPEMGRIGLQAGWVLVYTSAIVFVVRLFAGSIISRLTPFGTLAIASGLAAVGLLWLAGASGSALLAAATLYGIGKSFFWGTSLAVASEQFPRGGAVTLNVMAGSGMLAAGIMGSVLLGTLQDGAVARKVATGNSHLAATYLTEQRTSVFGSYVALDAKKVATAPPADKAALATVELAGKKSALTAVARLPILMLCVYCALILIFRRRGGYRRVTLPQNAG
ncbi:MAG TPA: MFS transporter [Sphingomonas sp.]|uniref:MFS transporter n=1 Tax=Sphingomonas sp. TaxID=28214 RepID=UPI002CE57A10|nr:MFS transporter [Sphingomonas sp.]HMI19148.1 MFS transporter [Sphingomonas sp.]